MRKIISVLLAAMLILSIAACGKQTGAQSSVKENTQSAEQETQPEITNSSTKPASEMNDDSTTEQADPSNEQEEEKVLVIYFSSANTVDADAISGATPRVDGLGVTEYLARLIHDQVGGELAKITPETDYPLDYNTLADVAKEERDDDERPRFTVDVNPEDYDVIFVGYPIWWYTRPMLIYSFFDAYDFSGKTLIPFNTHAGSRDGGTYTEIKEAEPNATVLDGLAVAGDRVDSDTESTVKDWLAGLDD